MNHYHICNDGEDDDGGDDDDGGGHDGGGGDDDDDDNDDLYPRSHALKSGLSECSGEVVILTAVVDLVIVMIS